MAEKVSQQEFINRYHKGLTRPALRYAMDNDLIDFEEICGRKYILLTDKTFGYVPKKSKKRDDKVAVMSL